MPLPSLQEDQLKFLYHISTYTSVTRFPHMIRPSCKASWSLLVWQYTQLKSKLFSFVKELEKVFDRYPEISATTFSSHCLYPFKFISLTIHYQSVPVYRFISHLLFYQETLILGKKPSPSLAFPYGVPSPHGLSSHHSHSLRKE